MNLFEAFRQKNLSSILYEDLGRTNFDRLESVPTTVIFPDGSHVYYHPDLLLNLLDMKKSNKGDRDTVLLMGGYTGSGKSVLGMQICKFFNPHFNIENIVYDHKKLIDIGWSLPSGSAILYDEAGESAASFQGANKRVSRLQNFLRVIRQKNHYIVLIMPDLWEFKTAIATQRADAYILVYEAENKNYKRHDPVSQPTQRGHFAFYNRKKLRELYVLGKKFHNYPSKIQMDFGGDFSNRYVVSEDEYRKKKLENSIAMMEEEEDKARKIPKGCIPMSLVAKKLSKDRAWTNKEIADFLSVNEKYVSSMISGKKIIQLEIDYMNETKPKQEVIE